MRNVIFVAAAFLSACGPKLNEAPPVAGAVHFEIDMASAVKAGWLDGSAERVGLRGGVPPLSWNETIFLDDPDGNGVYEGEVVFVTEADSIVPYKIKVEGSDNPNDGWEVGDNRTLIRTAGPRVKRAFDDTTEPLPATYTGDIRMHESFGSGDFVPPRNLVVYLPPNYETLPERRYPVLYMHDGQNVFDVRGAGSEWRFDETAEELISQEAIRPVIIVGVFNTPARFAEYTPSSGGRNPRSVSSTGTNAPTDSTGRLYARYLVEEVKPFIDATYRTEAGFESTSLGGSSLGGLITMSIGTWYPNVFSGLLVVSPSVWWDDEVIVRMVSESPPADGQRVWLDMGTREGDGSIGSAQRLRDALVAGGRLEGKELKFVVDEGAEHNESAWASRGPEMLRFLYGR